MTGRAGKAKSADEDRQAAVRSWRDRQGLLTWACLVLAAGAFAAGVAGLFGGFWPILVAVGMIGMAWNVMTRSLPVRLRGALRPPPGPWSR